MTHPTPPQTPLPVTANNVPAPQALEQWQSLLQQTIIQSHLGNVMTLPRWAEVSQPWKAS